MALLLSMYQKMRLTRKISQLTLRKTRVDSKRERITKNISNVQKRYASITQNIKNYANQLKNQYKQWTQNSIFGASTFNPTNFGNTGTTGYVLRAFDNWAANTTAGDNLYSANAQAMVEVMKKGGTFNPLIGDDKKPVLDANGKQQYVASNDPNVVISQEDYNTLNSVNYCAQQEQAQASYQCQTAQQNYENNVSIWETQALANIDAEENNALDPMHYEDQMLELESQEIEAMMAVYKAQLDTYKQDLAESAKDSSPKFGLA